jgi:hypothetical protein
MHDQSAYTQRLRTLRERAAELHEEFIRIAFPANIDWMPLEEIMRRRRQIVREVSAVRIEMAKIMVEKARVTLRRYWTVNDSG